MQEMLKSEKEMYIRRYNSQYEEHGYSPKALGWGKGKQYIRFDILTSLYDFNNKTVLDLGCGFGDLNKTLAKKAKNYNYIGVDLCDNFLNEGKKLYPNSKFVQSDFLTYQPDEKIDWAIASGPFNYLFENGSNYDFIKDTMEKTFQIVEDGFSFDFISDKVDFKAEEVFYASPEKILSFAYGLSRNVVLRNDYMPFEFSIFVFKDASFDKADTIFKRYKASKGPNFNPEEAFG